MGQTTCVVPTILLLLLLLLLLFLSILFNIIQWGLFKTLHQILNSVYKTLK